MHRTVLLAAAAAFTAALAAQSPLTTLYANNNSGSPGGSVMFDLTVGVSITITQIDVNCSSTSTVNTPGSLSVYTAPNTYVGSELNSSAWTLVGSGPLVVGAPNTPTICTLTQGIPLPTGSMGVMLVATGFGHTYTNGTGANQNWSNAELTMVCGAAQNVPWTAVFTPRVFNGSLHYAIGSNAASYQAYGTGCNSHARSWYENFPNATSFDLGGTATTSNGIMQIFAGNAYVVVPGANQWRTPTGTNLALGNDTEATRTLPFAFPFPGGSSNQLVVCSNGFVSFGGSNGVANLPAATALLAGLPRHCVYWHDLDPGTGGSVVYDVDAAGGAVYVTWLAVPATGTGGSNTFQIALFATGTVEYRYRQMGVAASTVSNVLIGWSPGGNARNPGNRDASATMPFFTDPTDSVPVALTASARPRLGTNTNLVTSAIPAGTPLGVMFFSFTRHDPGLSLAAIGMNSCSQYVGADATVAFVVAGTTNSLPIAIPANPIHIGTLVRCQSATFSPGFNPLGVLASNGLELRLDVQ